MKLLSLKRQPAFDLSSWHRRLELQAKNRQSPGTSGSHIDNGKADDAARSSLPSGISTGLSKILRPQAAYRWLLPSVAAITPQYIETTLRGALAGNHVQAWELFDLMEDTWPRLMKNCNEVKAAVQNMTPVFDAYQEEDAEPSATAIEKKKLVSAALRTMRPRAEADENSLAGTIYDIIDARFKGQAVQETDWEMREAGSLGNMIAPRCTYWVHPTCVAWDMDGVLGLRLELANGQKVLSPGVWQSTSSQPRPSQVAPFPPDKFIVAICKAKSGTALGGARFRSLCWWWCAANFSADWLLNLAQIFGLPLRWANYDPNAPQQTVDAICNMLQNMGSAAWAAFPAGTQLEIKEQGKTGDQSPQGDLLDRADRNCDLLILGQTLTTQMDGGGGSFAAAKVHSGVKDEVVISSARFVCDVINTQLIPSIVRLNYGEDSECPVMRLQSEKEEDHESDAEVISTLVTAGFGKRIGLDWLGKKFGIPKPESDEETLGDSQEADLTTEAQRAQGSKKDLAAKYAKHAKGKELHAKDAGADKSKALLIDATVAEYRRLNQRLEEISNITDAVTQKEKLAAALADLDEFEKNLAHDPRIANAVYKILVANVANGIAEAARSS